MSSHSLRFFLLVPLLMSCASSGEPAKLEVLPQSVETYSDWRVEAMPERVERGRYLAHSVANCIVCHSERAWNRHAGPVVEGGEGGGADLSYLRLTQPAPNITPEGIGDWSDAQLVQMLTRGLGPNGAAVHGFLPKGGFSSIALEDAYALTAYLRSLPPVKTGVQPGAVNANLAVASPYEHSVAAPPDPQDTVAEGRYLVQLASCRFCHGPNFHGGLQFQIGKRIPIETKDISDPSIGGADRDSFTGRFTAFSSAGARRLRSPEKLANTIMPWTNFGRMAKEDLGAIFDYLMSERPADTASQ